MVESTPKRGRGRPKGTVGTKRVLKAPKSELIDALESKITIEDNGCWTYPGTTNANGQAALYYDKVVHGSVHRVAYEVWVGPIPAKQYVIQRCENKLCCNPAHLYLGTFKEVVRIRDDAGKSIRGVRNPKAKLTIEQVDEIRRRVTAGEPVRVLAEEFSISAPTISQIKHGKSWKTA